MKRVAGVADCQFYGDGLPERQLRLTVDRFRLEALNLTMTELTDALRKQNLSVGVGTGDKSTIMVSGDVPEAESFGDILVKALAQEKTIRLKDVATIDVVSG